MLKLSDIRLPVDYTEEAVKNEIAKKLNISQKAVRSFEFVKLSVDARKKNDVHYNAAVKFSIDNRIVSEKDIIKRNRKNKVEYAPESRYVIKRFSVTCNSRSRACGAFLRTGACTART